MNKRKPHSNIKIYVENENLIMYGSSNESAGCVLRGILKLSLSEATKIKAITLQFIGRIFIILSKDERLFRHEKLIIDYKWSFLPKGSKLHVLNMGMYAYEFELALPGYLPESIHISNFYHVQYQLRATLERAPTFFSLIPNIIQSKPIRLSRQLLPFTLEFSEPVILSNQWANRFHYEIIIPSKIYTHGDQVKVTIRVTPLIDSLRVQHLSCILKEYMICYNRGLNSRPRAHNRVLFSTKDHKFGKMNNHNYNDHFIIWTKVQTIPLPNSIEELQYDIQNEDICIRHKIKFILSFTNEIGHISELRMAIPITICAVNQTGLPSYEEAWNTVPYNPMLDILSSYYHSNNNENDRNYSPNLQLLPPPAYEEVI
ncbi:uncharacterized protein BX663DRAFT_326917 [Cokeromyces recurvatus]|uniref:uncharacterized protein n=1 Tax=Cokeromyces recurvatus TaxID=90255 RepID=UPI00221EF9A9|nr:uncharacterized protein BX663DRAFT_326917 [Cokeromyces recurvatus]KAI7904747.1 hypothetical protein BX663DRAFT_326917 [Cokeromyces recurvatus]